MEAQTPAALSNLLESAQGALQWNKRGKLVEEGGLAFLLFPSRKQDLETSVVQTEVALRALSLQAVVVDGGVGVFFSSAPAGLIAATLVKNARTWGCLFEDLVQAVDTYARVCEAALLTARKDTVKLVGIGRADKAGQQRIREAFLRLNFQWGRERTVKDVLDSARRGWTLDLSWPAEAPVANTEP